MKYLRLPIVALSAGVLLTAFGLCTPASVAAHTTQTDGSKTTTTTTTTTTTGFATGTVCQKTGVYRAANKYLEVIIVLGNGEEFPPFIDGEQTTWYALEATTKSDFDAVKVPPGSN